MKWSWKLAEFRGIGVYMHATFLILIAFVVLTHWSAGNTVAKTLEGVVFILALFACVLLHEFGHALMAARYGIKTRDITLLPIGGLARLERMPDEPIQELWVALAGPAVNVVIAAALFVWLQFSAALAPLEQLSVTSGPFLERLMVVNVILVVFNMLPAFPMDGGRVLRTAGHKNGIHARNANRCEHRTGDGITVWVSWVLSQSVLDVHRLLCVDRRGSRSEHGDDEGRVGRHSSQSRHDDRLPHTAAW